MYFVICNWNTF